MISYQQEELKIFCNRPICYIINMKKVVSSGGIIVKKVEGKMRLLLVSLPGVKGLVFPKGHVDSGETIKQAAIREVIEETGLRNLKIIKKLGVVTRPARERDGKEVVKDIHLYFMKADNLVHSEADENYGWYTVEEALVRLYPQESEFLQKNLKYLESKI